MRSLRRSTLFGIAVSLSSATAVSQAQRAEIRPEYQDTTVRACSDFYSFANGGWQRSTVLPASKRFVGASQEASDRASSVLKEILTGAAANYRTSADRTTQKLGTFYASCIDSARADRDGLKPVRAELDRIDRITSREDLAREMGRLQLRGVNAGFGTMQSFASPQSPAWAYADMKNSTRNILWLFQGGMGLPEPGYYTRKDSASDAIRMGYRAHIARMLVLGGTASEQATKHAATILDLETKLAQASLIPQEQSEPTLVYEPTTVSKLATMTPAIAWTPYFRELGISRLLGRETRVSAAPGKFFQRWNELVERVPMQDWRSYLRWQLLHSVGPYLGSQVARESFSLDALLTGVTEPPSRSSRCTAQTDAVMGMAIGESYVKRTFPPSAKKRVEDLVANLRIVLRDRIVASGWMGDDTKIEALKKVDVIRVEVGYPSKWVDYGPVQISAEKLFVQNLLSLRMFENRRHLAKLERPVDRGEWEMSPATVNAYENPQFNALFFPAAILQPPRFSADADDAVNYGALGMVIGHELTHFFDDQGRQFDAHGNLRDWWPAEDAKRYQARADVVRRQYDSYVAIDTLHENGRLTLNENIADIGGLTIAYYAFHRALAANPGAPLRAGLTPDQQFFLATAQSWRWKSRPQEVRRRVFVDGHALPYWRINGPFSSLPQFGAAFSCKDGDPMTRSTEERARLW